MESRSPRGQKYTEKFPDSGTFLCALCVSARNPKTISRKAAKLQRKAIAANLCPPQRFSRVFPPTAAEGRPQAAISATSASSRRGRRCATQPRRPLFLFSPPLRASVVNIPFFSAPLPLRGDIRACGLLPRVSHVFPPTAAGGRPQAAISVTSASSRRGRRCATQPRRPLFLFSPPLRASVVNIPFFSAPLRLRGDIRACGLPRCVYTSESAARFSPEAV